MELEDERGGIKSGSHHFMNSMTSTVHEKLGSLLGTPIYSTLEIRSLFIHVQKIHSKRI